MALTVSMGGKTSSKDRKTYQFLYSGFCETWTCFFFRVVFQPGEMIVVEITCKWNGSQMKNHGPSWERHKVFGKSQDVVLHFYQVVA